MLTSISQPFLALTKSATTPRQAADLVTRATSAPNTYLFTELLQTPQIQSLSSSPDYKPYLTLLQIFSHGTYKTYTTTTPSLPPLSGPQLLKLRQLSLLTLAKDRHLSYSSLLPGLGLSSARELEDLVTTSIYASLIDATLDPAHATVHIHSVAPLRDVPPPAVPALLSSLRAWAARCDAALSDLEVRLRAVRAAADARAEKEKVWGERFGWLVEDEDQGTFDGMSGGGGGGPQKQHHAAGLPARASVSHDQGHGLGRPSRYGKRGSGHMDRAANDVGDEAMDLDDEDEVIEDKKRISSRRKLL
jgi:COP9 signalosome complex subunit 7